MSDPGSGAVRVRAQVACFDRDRLLCARHCKADETYLVLPGGHVEPGETLPEAVRRETREETGLELEDVRLWAAGEFLAPRRHVIDLTFYARAWRGEPRLGTDPDAGEHPASLVGLTWLDRSDLAASGFRPALLRDHLLEHWAEPDADFAYLGAARA